MKNTGFIDEKSVFESLTRPMPIKVLDETDSTNLEARRMLAAKQAPPFTVFALRQTSGRGRLGRSFYSPKGGIYMSAAYPLAGRSFRPLLITSAVAVAVCRGIERSTGIRPGIKWVNDIWLGEKKLCGILCETTDNLASVIAGIGINYQLDPDRIPDPLQEVITSLFEEVPPVCSAPVVAAAVLDALAETFETPSHKILSDYRERSIILGRQIVFTKNGVSRLGRAEEIDDDAGLIVRTDKGRVCLNTGEISIRPAK